MIDLFETIVSVGLTPNEAYLLFSINEKIQPKYVNVHQELRGLKEKGWIEGEYTLTEKSLQFVKEFGTVKNKKKLPAQLEDPRFLEYVKEFVEIFPKLTIPTSGKPARSNVKDLAGAFKWFFANHQYSWEQVMDATRNYVSHFESKNWYYMSTSQYFVRKQQNDKSVVSILADYCEQLSGPAIETPKFGDEVK